MFIRSISFGGGSTFGKAFVSVKTLKDISMKVFARIDWLTIFFSSLAACHRYYHMGMIYFAMFVLGGATTVYVTYMNEAKLYRLGEVHGKARVKRDGGFVELLQKDLVPGDIIAVEPGQCHCDMLLFKAGTILADESGITGEATPVAKTAADAAALSALYSASEHKKNTISAGSIILETGEESGQEALAIVTQTGSFTTKGNLLRDILFYERHQFKFDHEVCSWV